MWNLRSVVNLALPAPTQRTLPPILVTLLGRASPSHQTSLAPPPNVIYTVGCMKDTGECARLKGPQYVGCTSRAGKVRFSEHVGSVVQPCQANTRKTVGVHFRSPGHTHSQMKFLPIEKVRCRDRFVLEAREDFWIKKYEAVKSGEVDIIEHGLNLK